MLTLKLNMTRCQPSRYRMKREKSKRELFSDHRAVRGGSDMSLWEFSMSVLRRLAAARDPERNKSCPLMKAGDSYVCT